MLRPLGESSSWAWFPAKGFGRGVVVCADDRIVGVLLPGTAEEFARGASSKPATSGLAAEMAARLAECFGTGRDAGDLPHRIVCRTTFQHRVLAACHCIPHGGTWSYARLAREAGAPRAVRAAASVMAMNPLPLVIPCHRVIRADGSLGEFGGGSTMKRRLLDLEAAAR